jgi:hypothetical protein
MHRFPDGPVRVVATARPEAEEGPGRFHLESGGPRRGSNAMFLIIASTARRIDRSEVPTSRRASRAA